MAVAVIILFEKVNIQQQDSQGTHVDPVLFQGCFHGFLQIAPVSKRSEGIGHGQQVQLLVGGLQLQILLVNDNLIVYAGQPRLVHTV